ncbi:hypothetical protein Tco_0454375 [Tanacetum coccineum]
MIGGLSRGTPGDNIGSTSKGPPKINVETPLDGATPSAREQIERHMSALRSLLKEHNERGNVSPIRLSFDDKKDQPRVQTVVTGVVGDADLKKPFKEAVKTPLTQRIIEFTLDRSARGWFENLSNGSIDGRAELKLQFTTRFSTRRGCFKDPTEITKIVRRANETLVAFKER